MAFTSTRNQQNVPEIKDALSKSGDEKARALHEICRSWQLALVPMFELWEEENRFVQGQQWGRFRRGRWRQLLPAPRKMIRAVLNQCQTVIAHLGAVHTKERPEFDVAAATDEGRDSAVAQVGSKIVKWMWRNFMLQDLYRDLVELAGTNGTSLLEVGWDESAGNIVTTTEVKTTTQKIRDPITGEEISVDVLEPEEVERPEGMPFFRVRRCWDVIPAPWARGDDDGEALFVEDLVSLADLVEQYGQSKVNKLVTGDSDEYGWWGGRDPMRAATYPHREQSDVVRDETVRVFTCYVRKTKSMPRGRKVVFTSEILLEDTENPVYPADQNPETLPPRVPWPIFAFRHYRQPTGYYGKGVIRDLIHPQVQLNALVSKALTILKSLAHPFMLAPQGFDEKLVDDFQTVLKYSVRHGPEAVRYLSPPPFPAELLHTAQFYIQQIFSLAGISEASLGRSDSEASGRKVQLLQQADLGRQAPIKANHDRMMANALQLALSYMRLNASGPRKLTIVGDNNRAQVEEFDLSTLPATTDVYVVNGVLSSDPTQRILQFSSMLQATAGLSATERNRLLELTTGYADILEVPKEQMADREKAKFENLRMYEGQPMPVEFWEDDEQHLAIHFAEMNTQEWFDKHVVLPGEDQATALQKQERRQVWEQHVADHLQQMQTQQMQQQVAGPGGTIQDQVQQSQVSTTTPANVEPVSTDNTSVGAPTPAVTA